MGASGGTHWKFIDVVISKGWALFVAVWKVYDPPLGRIDFVILEILGRQRWNVNIPSIKIALWVSKRKFERLPEWLAVWPAERQWQDWLLDSLTKILQNRNAVSPSLLGGCMPGMGMPGMGVQMGPMAPMGGMAPMAPMGMQPSFQNFAMDGCGVGNLNSGMGRGWFKIRWAGPAESLIQNQ